MAPRFAPTDRGLESAPSARRLRELFERSGLRLSDLQVQQFWSFHQLLRRRNAELDLTRLHAFDTMVLKHYVDCALVATLVDLPSPLLDLGSGAGFPGIPLKIVRPDVHVLLGEPRPKRVAFLEEAIRALGLRGIEVVPQSIGARFDRPVRGVITRAVASMPATLARVAPWLAPGGRVLFMKGPGAEAEMAAATRDWSDRFRVGRDLPYSIPQTPHARRLVVWERLEDRADAAASVAGGLWGDPEAADDDFDLDGSSDDAWPSEIEGERSANAAVPQATDSHADAAFGAPGDTDADLDDETDLETAFDLAAARDDAAMAPAPEPATTHGPASLAGLHAGRTVRDLNSDSNSTFKLLRLVLAARGVRKHHRALLAGSRPVHEVIRDHPERALAWITSGPAPAPPGDSPPTLAWYRVAPALFRQLDVFGTGTPLLLLDAPPLETWTDTAWPPGCSLFVPFQDPENVGAVIRTAAALGVARVVLLQEAANPFHPRSARVAGSALLRVPLLRGPSIREFAAAKVPLWALSPHGDDIAGCEFPPTFGLLVGLEGPGLPPGWSGRTLGIPMQPGNESLNAAAATAIALYLWSRQTR